MPFLLGLVLTLSVMMTVIAQELTAQPQQRELSNEAVVRISVALVQVDAVVTDKKGNHVTGLSPEDFEIFEDGRLQKITHFSYVLAQSTSQSLAASPAERTPSARPPIRLRPDQVRRTIALVVDDLGMSFESMAYVNQALRKFVDEQMQPGDLVAIVRTGAGMGALQQFTSDSRQLYAAIERVRWNPSGRGGISAFAPIESNPLESRDRRGSEFSDHLDQYREDLFSIGTLGAINFVVRGLRELPGRKSIVLLSDGIRIFRPSGSDHSSILDYLRRLTDLANRASVVIYAIDARGLQTLGLAAQDNPTGLSERIEKHLQDRRLEFFESQDGLNYLALQTGGLFAGNTNDISGAIARVLEDQRGYYLIGYQANPSTFNTDSGRQRFHKISVKVKRPGLRVRSRTGFFGISDEEIRSIRHSRNEQLMVALSSPFVFGGLNLRLTSLFGHDPEAGSLLRSLLYIDARELTLSPEADGFYKTVLDVMASTNGDDGRVIDHFDRTITLRTRGESNRRMLQNGLAYTLNVPVRRAGAYQFRIAVRDAASGQVGSANQFVEVPDLKRGHLTLSGIAVSGTDPSIQGAISETQALPARQATGKEEGSIQEGDPQASPAVRRFRPGMLLTYVLLLYNYQPDRRTGQPNLELESRLVREGREIERGTVAIFDPGQRGEFKRLVATGTLKLSPNVEPGEYFLQIVAVDKLAKEKYRRATQWIDFDVIK